MTEFLQSLAATAAFSNAFWVFVGIVAGALIQHFLGYLQGRRQAKNAFKVMQIEIEYNLSEVARFLEHVNWLKSRIQAGQIAEDELFLPMQKFDYSSIAPLANSGYFHILLGPNNVRKYLEFTHFFRIDNGQNVTRMLRTEHGSGRSLAHLEWVERRAKELSTELKTIGDSSLRFGKLRLRTK